MLEVNADLKKKFEETASAMRLRLEKRPSPSSLRSIIAEKGLRNFVMCERLGQKELSGITQKGGIVGVDGSTNSAGGPFPYLFTLQQALAKLCISGENDLLVTDAFSPLITEDVANEEEYQEFVKHNLAQLEAKAALLALEKFKPAVILLDGSLVRYKIEAGALWNKLKEEAISQKVLLAGVVEGISTGIISQCLKDALDMDGFPASDWEILFGLLQVGEALEIMPGLFKEGFRTLFMRSSLDPKPIGIDLLEEQQEAIGLVPNLVFTLTPKESRGIPLWLDIIDKSVRISDAVMEGLLHTYLGEDYVEFIKPKREKREM